MIKNLEKLNTALGGWWDGMGDLVKAHYPWQHCINTIPNCLAISADGSIMLKFQVQDGMLVPRNWTKYGAKPISASETGSTKIWMEWLGLEFNTPISGPELLQRVLEARKVHQTTF